MINSHLFMCETEGPATKRNHPQDAQILGFIEIYGDLQIYGD